MPRRSLLLFALAGACGGSAPAGVDGGAPILTEAGPEAAPLPPQCEGAAVPPSRLECTGLYADLAAKVLAPGIEPYAPAVPLWSDGAEKQRWVLLPSGTTIDSSNPSEWVFPVGTKFWKQFSVGGKRIETRMWQKVRSDYWVYAAYAWNADETQAVQSPGGDISIAGGGTYHIPTGDECEKCHRGRTEHILGFEEVELGLPGATGITLADLVRRGLLSTPRQTSLTIGDDGTGAAAPALGWLHANCGITCHNGNSNAIAYPSGLRFRLDATQLDGRSSAGFDPLKTGVGVAVNAPNWKGQVRIVPGDPDASLLYYLISHRGPGMQMPPIATRVVDEANVALVRRWIAAMPPLPKEDAGPPDAGIDAGVDATPDVVETPDVAPDLMPDAGAPDAEPDAEVDAALDAEPDAAADVALDAAEDASAD